MPDEIMIDLEDFTLGELEEFEEIVGMSLSTVRQKLLGDEPLPQRVVTALVFIAQRRRVPGYTLEDARAERSSSVRWPAAPEKDAERSSTDPTPLQRESGAA